MGLSDVIFPWAKICGKKTIGIGRHTLFSGLCHIKQPTKSTKIQEVASNEQRSSFDFLGSGWGHMFGSQFTRPWDISNGIIRFEVNSQNRGQRSLTWTQLHTQNPYCSGSSLECFALVIPDTWHYMATVWVKRVNIGYPPIPKKSSSRNIRLNHKMEI